MTIPTKQDCYEPDLDTKEIYLGEYILEQVKLQYHLHVQDSLSYYTVQPHF